MLAPEAHSFPHSARQSEAAVTKPHEYSNINPEWGLIMSLLLLIRFCMDARDKNIRLLSVGEQTATVYVEINIPSMGGRFQTFEFFDFGIF